MKRLFSLSFNVQIFTIIVLGSFLFMPQTVGAVDISDLGHMVNDSDAASKCQTGVSIEGGKLFRGYLWELKKVNDANPYDITQLYCLADEFVDQFNSQGDPLLASECTLDSDCGTNVCMFVDEGPIVGSTNMRGLEGVCQAPACKVNGDCQGVGAMCTKAIVPIEGPLIVNSSSSPIMRDIIGLQSCFNQDEDVCLTSTDCGQAGPNFAKICEESKSLVTLSNDSVGFCVIKNDKGVTLKENDYCNENGSGLKCGENLECRKYDIIGDIVSKPKKNIGSFYCEVPYRKSPQAPEIKSNDKATFGSTIADDVVMANITIPIGELTKFDQPLVAPCRGKVLQSNTETECLQIPWIAQYIGAAYKFGAAFGALLAVLVMMIGGILYILGGANASYLSSGKAYIVQAAFGLILILGSFIVLNLLNPNLTNLPVVEVERVARVETLCCQLSPARQGVVPVRSFETAQPTKKGEQPKCSNGSDPLQPSKCSEGAAVGGYCCLDPKSPSNQACTSLSSGSEQYRCLPVQDSDGPCGIAAKVAVLSPVLALVGTVSPEVVVPVLEGVAKASVIGAKAAVSLSLTCVANTACLTTVGTAVLINSMNSEANCSYKSAGVCAKVNGYKQLENGDMCNSDEQCREGECIPGLAGMQCWGTVVGFCSSGKALPVDREGGGGCDDTKIGLGNEAGCKETGAVCAYFKPTNSLFVETKLAACSLGLLGHACGGQENICKDNLRCNDDGICVPEGGFLPAGTNYKCSSHAMCESAFAFCDNAIELKCKHGNSPAGCISQEYAGKCVSKREIGKACVDNIQCISGLCDKNLGESGNDSGLCACAPEKAIGCKKEGDVCVAKKGDVGACVNYTKAKKTVAVDANGSVFSCSQDSDCLSDDCDAEYNGTKVCDCDDATDSAKYDQCPVGWTCRDLDSFGDKYDNEACINPVNLKKAESSCTNGSECRSGTCENGKCTCASNNDCPTEKNRCLDNGTCSAGAFGMACSAPHECNSGVCTDEFDSDFCSIPPEGCPTGVCMATGYTKKADCSGGAAANQKFCDCDSDWKAIVQSSTDIENLHKYANARSYLPQYGGYFTKNDCEIGYQCVDVDNTAYSDNDACVKLEELEEWITDSDDKKELEIIKELTKEAKRFHQSGS